MRSRVTSALVLAAVVGLATSAGGSRREEERAAGAGFVGRSGAIDSVIGARLRSVFLTEILPRGRWPRLSDVAADLRQAYDSAGWTPLWLRDLRPTPAALGVIAYLGNLRTVGLQPADFDTEALDSLAARLTGHSPGVDDALRFESTMSVAVARVLASLQWGRVKPQDVHEHFSIPHHDYSLPSGVRAAAAADDPAQVFAAAEPPLLHYRLLKAQLARHRDLARDSTAPDARARMVTRLRQIELSLERWRWLPHSFPGRVVIVNIPEFRLHAFDHLAPDSVALFSMDVVVGQAYDHQTPIFMKELQRLAFSPYWEVPPSIARKEIKPAALRSRSYLERNHYVLLRGEKEVPRTAENIAAMGSSVRVRQLPGKDNALGRVKFVFPNPHNVYMHDTPVQDAFARDRRDLSHGCIRLSDPVKLAAWVLRDRPEWTPELMEEAMSRRTPLDVPVDEQIPVFILYGTAIAERSGEMKFYRDIYEHDRRLTALLARGFPYPR